MATAMASGKALGMACGDQFWYVTRNRKGEEILTGPYFFVGVGLDINSQQERIACRYHSSSGLVFMTRFLFDNHFRPAVVGGSG